MEEAEEVRLGSGRIRRTRWRKKRVEEEASCGRGGLSPLNRAHGKEVEEEERLGHRYENWEEETGTL